MLPLIFGMREARRRSTRTVGDLKPPRRGQRKTRSGGESRGSVLQESPSLEEKHSCEGGKLNRGCKHVNY